MKLLHTSDWHVGKEIRGHSRAEEHSAVLSEIVAIAGEHEVELVVVAGDLFETSAPSAQAEETVYRTLLDLAADGRRVAVVSGNHDNARRLRAVAPLLELADVHLVSQPQRPDDGGVVRFEAGDGTPVNLALLPFVSQRGIVRATDLMELAAFEAAQAYADRLQRVIDALCADLPAGEVNLMAAHAFVPAAMGEQGPTGLGGGERLAHLANEYRVPAQSFPPTLGYVALGHLHRPQQIPGATAIHYCGSPLQLDFGESAQTKQVNVVAVEPGAPARVDVVPLRSGRPLHTLTGTVDELEDQAAALPEEAWIRVRVKGKGRAGLANEVRERLGERVVDVLLADRIEERSGRESTSRRGRSPHELFGEFLAERSIDDRRLVQLFDELLDDDAGVA